ncbi:MAG: hypothetical protein ACFFCM_13985, partial [Promethearchaeota archaeon]
YIVYANNTNGNYYLWEGPTSWNRQESLDVAINRSETGVYSYIIKFCDNQQRNGTENEVIVTIKAVSAPIPSDGGDDDDDDEPQDTFIEDLIRQGVLIPMLGAIVSAIVSGLIGLLFWKYKKKKEKRNL